MCPPDGCLATGCVGSRIADKQPVACGVDTVNADIGTTYTLTYVVYNSAGMEATAQRVISVISPCDSGKYLCGSTCSAVSTAGSSVHVREHLQCEEWRQPRGWSLWGNDPGLCAGAPAVR